ncbi:MAG: MgtC/SapB family protein [Sphingobacteriaceae bacterium]
MKELFEHEYFTRTLVSIICGSIIGLERQYRNKAAGFRTIVLICLGSTIFTIVSQRMGGSDDRVAANILTGIGFIGAGVIFNDRVTVKGLTTASVIWTMAAIGMVVGINDIYVGFFLTIIVLIVLSILQLLEKAIDYRHHMKTFSITFHDHDTDYFQQVKELIIARKLTFVRRRVSISNNELQLVLEVTGHQEQLEYLTQQLLLLRVVKACDVF